MGEGVAAVGAVNEFESLADAAEDDGVLADDVTGADGKQRNLFFGPFTDDAFAAVDADFVQIAVQRVRHRTTQRQRRTARSILFEAMVGLDNLHVIIVAKYLGRLAKKRDEDIDAQARVGRKESRRAARESFDLGQLRRVESGSCNDDGNCLFGCVAQIS